MLTLRVWVKQTQAAFVSASEGCVIKGQLAQRWYSRNLGQWAIQVDVLGET